MLIQKIGKLCKGAGSIVIVTRSDGSQWLGTPSALYPVFGIKLTQESVFALFDIGDKREDYHVTEIFEDELNDHGLSICDADEFEIPLQYRGVNVFGAARRELMPLETEREVLLIDPDYLTPLKDVPETQCFMRRSNSGVKTVAVKSGFQIVALIATEKLREFDVDALRRVASLACTVSNLDVLRPGTLFDAPKEVFKNV